MSNTDYLYEAAVFYKENLANKRFRIHIRKKDIERSIELLFLPEHFRHLIGLHKLTDLPFLSRPPKHIYHEILSKKLTYSDIGKSEHIGLIADRLLHYREMSDILHADSLFFKSMRGYFKGIVADCVLTKSVSTENLFSFLFLKQNNNVYFPCSFFTRNEQKEYTKDGTNWTIVSIVEIPK